jgi:hypothetical protein
LSVSLPAQSKGQPAHGAQKDIHHAFSFPGPIETVAFEQELLMATHAMPKAAGGKN